MLYLCDLVNTLTIPVDVEFRDSEAEYLFTRKSNKCDDFLGLKVVRWWPESREKIVVFLDFANVS